MCRLLGFAAPGATTVGRVLGAQSDVFHDMARLHRDGWGSAWVADAGVGSHIETLVSPESGWNNTGLLAALADQPASARVVHLRLATDGMVCGTQNTHPFAADGMAFAHNGSLEPLGALERLVSRRRAAALTGTTDSERYFAAISSRIDEGATALEAATLTAAALREAFPDRSLNALLLTTTQLIAVHASEHSPVPTHEFGATGLLEHEIPRHHDDRYYLMRIRREADGTVVIASSGLDIAGWEALPPESVTSVDLATLEVRTRSIAASSALPLASAQRQVA